MMGPAERVAIRREGNSFVAEARYAGWWAAATAATPEEAVAEAVADLDKQMKPLRLRHALLEDLL